MKRIKALIFSWAMLMAVIMVANVSWAGQKQVLFMQGGGLEFFNEETGEGILKCPIINLGSGEQGTSTLEFEAHIVDGEEKIVNANYTYERDNGEKVEGNEIRVIEFTNFKNGEDDNKYLVSCVCAGTVSGTWNGVPVTQLTCRCLLEITVNPDGSISMTCQACVASLT